MAILAERALAAVEWFTELTRRDIERDVVERT
jgi:hypothetical protein